MRFDPGNLVARQLVLDDDLRPRAHPPYLCRQVPVVELQRLRDRRQVLPLDLIAIEQQRIGSLVVDDHAPVAVEDLAARRQDRRALDAVSLRRFAVDVRIFYLQFPEARDQKNKNSDRQGTGR